MKQIVLILISIFLFFGCTQKQQVIEIKKDEQNIAKTQIPKTDKADEESFSQEVINEVKAIKDEDLDDGVFKLAIIYPSKIVGKYANNTVNTITGYLLFKNEKFKIETFDTIDETPTSIEEKIKEIETKNYSKIIALFTETGYDKMTSFSFDSKTKVYFPLLNKDNLFLTKENFIYGGISYKRQIELLQTMSNNKNVMYFQNNYLGNKLKTIYENSVPSIEIIKEVSGSNNDYKALVDNEKLEEASIMLNTSIIKTSILLSQIRGFQKQPSVILSTQLNYNPLLISLTQAEDRINFIIANSIDKTDEKLEDILDSFDSEIVYDWVNYSSLIGVNLLFNNNKDELIKTKIEENKVYYEPKLYNATEYGFQKIK